MSDDRLSELTNYKGAFALVKTVALVSIIVGVGGVIIALFLYNKAMDENLNRIWVMDASGKVNVGVQKNAQDPATRIFEYKDQVRDFYLHWYQMDEGSYNRNIEHGLNLVGECGKELLEEYREIDVLRKLQEKNLVITVEIERVNIDMLSSPPRGEVIGIQTIRRPGGMLKRRMDCTFTFFDVARSKTNSHGVKIENWEVVNNEKIN